VTATSFQTASRIRGFALHGQILAVTTSGDTDQGNMIVPLLEPLIVELLTPQG
jgi:hypothetical protein